MKKLTIHCGISSLTLRKQQQRSHQAQMNLLAKKKAASL
jgi:hypothetical protein